MLQMTIHKAGIAQLVECKLPKLDVAGSNPVARSFACLSLPNLALSNKYLVDFVDFCAIITD